MNSLIRPFRYVGKSKAIVLAEPHCYHLFRGLLMKVCLTCDSLSMWPVPIMIPLVFNRILMIPWLLSPTFEITIRPPYYLVKVVLYLDWYRWTTLHYIHITGRICSVSFWQTVLHRSNRIWFHFLSFTILSSSNGVVKPTNSNKQIYFFSKWS